MTVASRIVNPAEIQDTLNHIWESYETKNITRASLFNLIFYVQKSKRLAYVQELAQKVIEKFPSRVILISVNKESAEDFLKTEVSILSSSKGEYDVACDFIQFEASGASTARIPFVVLPHILPDLPIYIAWAEDPCKKDPLFQQLDPLASRLIFDSEATEGLAHFCKSILAHHVSSHTDIADLNWARVESWRDLLSMVFYSEENLHCLERSKSIAISYNAQESQFFSHTRVQSIYLQAWIACQLNWECKGMRKEKDVFVFSYQSAYSPIEIRLNPAIDVKLPPGLILSMDITTLDQRTFSFSRNLEQLHRVTFNASDPNQCALPAHYILQKAESGHSLVKEITHRGTSKHFLKVLNLLQNLNQMDSLGKV
ncbi:MAG TPA: glucose-6-phosphate dehydrogenase assembly protein OpcA [Rhabdochlamydiaceae bacterium]